MYLDQPTIQFSPSFTKVKLYKNITFLINIVLERSFKSQIKSFQIIKVFHLVLFL